MKMIELRDLYNIAESMDRQMLDLNVKSLHDYRGDITIQIQMEDLNFLMLDETLYEKEKNTMVGYDPGDEINVKILGISFKLVKKKEAE